jgi:hypothetical protein
VDDLLEAQQTASTGDAVPIWLGNEWGREERSRKPLGAGDGRDRQGDNNVRYVISGSIAGVLSDRARVRAIGSEQVKAITAPIAICEYAPI